MIRSRADLQVVGNRAVQRPVSRNTGPAGTNLLARLNPSYSAPGFTGTRRHGNKRTGKGGSGAAGTKSEWTGAMTYWTDPKWSYTATINTP